VIEGYANSDVIAILLPVIENAIEAARPATVVTIAYSLLDDGEHRLRVSGESMNEPGSDRIYEAGFTTKDGHEGLGLAAARSLADRFPGAGLTHVSIGTKVHFDLVLRARRD